MSAKFVSATLGLMYRKVNDDGSVSGGPMYYISKRLPKFFKPLAWLFACSTVFGAFGAGGMFQANQAASALHTYFDISKEYNNSDNFTYNNSKNYGKIKIINKYYSFQIDYPNAFYSGLGTKYIEPHVIIRIIEPNKNISKPIFIKLKNGLPYRSLTHSPPPYTWPRSDPLFYYSKDKLPIRTQEQILRDSQYPKNMKFYPHFWGTRPPP